MTEPANPEQVPPVSRKKKSLTLVWALGVVVLVLLCLGAIATPKFGGFSSMCRSKQSEAKTNLSGLFTSEKAFFSENNYYTTDLISVNWRPDGAPVYAYGFAAPSSAGPDPNLPELDPTRRNTIDPRVAEAVYRVEHMKTSDGRALADEDFRRLLPAATASSSAFLVAAIGNIDSDETLDVWTMNHERKLEIVTNDCSD